MCRKQWPSEFTLKAFLSNLSFCVLISNGHLISFSSQSFEAAHCFCSRLRVLMREMSQNGVTFEWCLFDVLFFGLFLCFFSHSPAWRLSYRWVSVSDGWPVHPLALALWWGHWLHGHERWEELWGCHAHVWSSCQVWLQGLRWGIHTS